MPKILAQAMPNLLLTVSRPTALVLADAGPDGHERLSPPERERLSRLRRSADRQDFLAAHLLVRLCAARIVGVDAGGVSIVQRCATCGGPHGRPEIVGHPDVAASLAHSRGVVAAAAGTGPVGVDVEAFPTAEGLVAGDLSAALTATERAAIEAAANPQHALLLAWARKEACLKAGLVDLDDLAEFDLSALPLDPAGGDLVPRSERYGDWAVHDWWDGRAGAIGAVVAPAAARLTLSGE
jgi:4'-phosphopantetheinyl transferase